MSGSRSPMLMFQKATEARPGSVWQDQIPCNGVPRSHFTKLGYQDHGASTKESTGTEWSQTKAR